LSKENKLASLPDEFYPSKDLNDLTEFKRNLKCKQFIDYYFGESKPELFISNEEIKELFEKVESQNCHFETENGKTITFEDLIRIKDLGLKCVLFIIRNHD
jgi:uncharacterized membrane protein